MRLFARLAAPIAASVLALALTSASALAGPQREARPGADADVLAEAVLAPLAGDLYAHLRDGGTDPERIRAAVHAVARGALAG